MYTLNPRNDYYCSFVLLIFIYIFSDNYNFTFLFPSASLDFHLEFVSFHQESIFYFLYFIESDKSRILVVAVRKLSLSLILNENSLSLGLILAF